MKKTGFLYCAIAIAVYSISSSVLADCSQPQLSTYSPENRLVSIPTVRLPSGECFNATLELTQGSPGMQFVLKSATPYPNGSTPINKSKTEMLIGSWDFTYTIISSYVSKYVLSGPATELASNPGYYYVTGTDEYNEVIAAAYDSSLGQYTLLDQGTIIDRFYTFDLPAANMAQGCFYLITKSTDEWSTCYSMTGKKTSSPPVGPGNTAQLARADNRIPGEELESQLVEQDTLVTDLAARFQGQGSAAQSAKIDVNSNHAQYRALTEAANLSR